MKKFYSEETCKHNRFSGKIFPSDFDRHTTLSEVADRILSDQRFDEQCRRNILARDKVKK